MINHKSLKQGNAFHSEYADNSCLRKTFGHLKKKIIVCNSITNTQNKVYMLKRLVIQLERNRKSRFIIFCIQ